MSPETDLLPRFRSPPVSEVAVGVQFEAPWFLPVHYGAFYDRVKGEYPGVQTFPPLPPATESFSAPSNQDIPEPLRTLLGPGPFPLPRVLFVSADDCSLIQVQSDRLYFNWRKRDNADYPHYSHFRQKFAAAYGALEAIAAEQGTGLIAPSQCDVLYVNPLPHDVTGVQPSSHHSVFRVWNAAVGSEWSTPLEDLSFNARYRLADDGGTPIGRLTATMSTVWNNGVAEMRLEVVARGTPQGEGLGGILAFHDIGHDAIVRCFTAMTTAEMQARWGRHSNE